ncbi:PAAR-like domain-containing protein [Candidatus Omnitrophota bacterium]
MRILFFGLLCLLFAAECLAGDEGSAVNVFVSPRGVSAKSSSGKSIGAMPDVCNTPPSPPGGPIPIPYPNTASAADTTKGSKKVKMGGSPVMAKGSEYEQSTSDEPGTDEEEDVSHVDITVPTLKQDPVKIPGFDLQ